MPENKIKIYVSSNNDKKIVNVYRRMIEIINNPQPLRKPPHSCPVSCYSKVNECKFPNCLCEWRL